MGRKYSLCTSHGSGLLAGFLGEGRPSVCTLCNGTGEGSSRVFLREC